MAREAHCMACGHVGTPDGPGLLDRGILVGAWGALVLGAAGGVMLGPHFTLFILPLFVPPYLGLMSWAHGRALRTPECTACGCYVEAMPGRTRTITRVTRRQPA